MSDELKCNECGIKLEKHEALKFTVSKGGGVQCHRCFFMYGDVSLLLDEYKDTGRYNENSNQLLFDIRDRFGLEHLGWFISRTELSDLTKI